MKPSLIVSATITPRMRAKWAIITNREPPFFFMKPADAIVATDSAVPYPCKTSDYHNEIELVVALAKGDRLQGHVDGLPDLNITIA